MCLADFDAGIRAGVPDLYKLPLKLGVGAVVKRSVCPRECLIIQCFISLFLISQVPPAVNDMCKQNFAKICSIMTTSVAARGIARIRLKRGGVCDIIGGKNGKTECDAAWNTVL